MCYLGTSWITSINILNTLKILCMTGYCLNPILQSMWVPRWLQECFTISKLYYQADIAYLVDWYINCLNYSLILYIYNYQVASSSTKDLVSFSFLESEFSSSFSDFLVGAVTTNIHPTKHDIDGTKTVNHLTNSSWSKTVPYEQKNSTIPEEILSRKLYAPKTNAPLEPFKPITSLISVIPVFNVIA